MTIRTMTSTKMIALAAGLMLVIAAAMTTTPRSAGAISPPQTTGAGVVTLLGNNNAGGIQRFWSTTFSQWGPQYKTPLVYYYNSATGMNYQTPCANTASWPRNGFYCSTDNRIYLDYSHMQTLTNQYGDYATGGFLAHEWGHAIQNTLRYRYVVKLSEYHADCLAGMYTRYGYMTGRLTGNDYGEFFNWLNGQPTSASHGIGSQRAAWYRYGYQTYSITDCNRVFDSVGGPHILPAGTAGSASPIH